MLTESTTLATTDVARDVHLGARLCEGEVARAQTNLCVRTKELACEGQEHLLKVCERHVFVNIQTFELMEEAMGACRNCLITEHTSGANDTYWWLLLLHNSALVVAGVRTQNDVLCHIVGVGLYEEGVLHVACGMVCSKVELCKHMQVIVNLRTFSQRESHTLEDVDNLVAHDGQRVACAKSNGVG